VTREELATHARERLAEIDEAIRLAVLRSQFGHVADLASAFKDVAIGLRELEGD
jgi:hypothetical protein